MSSSSSYQNPSLNDEYDQEEVYRNRYKKQATESLNKLNFEEHANRKLLSSAYRRLAKELTRIEQDRFKQIVNYDSINNSEDMIDDLTKSAYFYAPYDIENQQFKFYSSICKEATIGGRKCQQPLIKIDHQPVTLQNRQKIIIKQKPFLLVIQSQPNSTIIYTNKPRAHPLLIFTEKQQLDGYYKKWAKQRCEQMITPPCDLSIIAIRQPTKIESKLIYLKIMSNQNEQNTNRRYDMGWAIRPEESFNYEDSASGNAISYSMNEQSF